MVFYRNLMSAALDIAPDDAMEAIRDEVVGFTMPGAGMADFARRSVMIAKAGIYDLRLHHDEVVMPVLRHWRVFERDDFGPAGEKARDDLAAFLADLDARATRFVEKRAAAAARADAR
jgi:acyl-[acyl-carrier-protein] desaturase